MSTQQRPIGFLEALALLQGLLGSGIEVDISSNRLFLAANWAACLQRIETLPEDNEAVVLLFDGAETIELDPSELEAFAETDSSNHASRLEFRFEHGLVIKLAPISIPALGPNFP